jgi:hypothetical protein
VRTNFGCFFLTFVRHGFKEKNGTQAHCEESSRQQTGRSRRELPDEQGQAPKDSARAVERQDTASMTEAEIRKAMRRMILPGGGKRDQTATGARD